MSDKKQEQYVLLRILAVVLLVISLFIAGLGYEDKDKISGMDVGPDSRANEPLPTNTNVNSQREININYEKDGVSYELTIPTNVQTSNNRVTFKINNNNYIIQRFFDGSVNLYKNGQYQGDIPNLPTQLVLSQQSPASTTTGTSPSQQNRVFREFEGELYDITTPSHREVGQRLGNTNYFSSGSSVINNDGQTIGTFYPQIGSFTANNQYYASSSPSSQRLTIDENGRILDESYQGATIDREGLVRAGDYFYFPNNFGQLQLSTSRPSSYMVGDQSRWLYSIGTGSTRTFRFGIGNPDDDIASRSLPEFRFDNNGNLVAVGWEQIQGGKYAFAPINRLNSPYTFTGRVETQQGTMYSDSGGYYLVNSRGKFVVRQDGKFVEVDEKPAPQTGTGAWINYHGSWLNNQINKWSGLTQGFRGMRLFYKEPNWWLGYDDTMMTFLEGVPGWSSLACRAKVTEAADSGAAFSTAFKDGPFAHIEGEKIVVTNFSATPSTTSYLYKISFEVDPGADKPAGTYGAGCDMEFMVFIESPRRSLFKDSGNGADFVFKIEKGNNSVSYTGPNLIFKESSTNYNKVCIKFTDIRGGCLTGITSGEEVCRNIEIGDRADRIRAEIRQIGITSGFTGATGASSSGEAVLNI